MAVKAYQWAGGLGHAMHKGLVDSSDSPAGLVRQFGEYEGGQLVLHELLLRRT